MLMKCSVTSTNEPGTPLCQLTGTSSHEYAPVRRRIHPSTPPTEATDNAHTSCRYDSHKSDILRASGRHQAGGGAESFTPGQAPDDEINLFPYFSSTCFNGYKDGASVSFNSTTQGVVDICLCVSSIQEWTGMKCRAFTASMRSYLQSLPGRSRKLRRSRVKTRHRRLQSRPLLVSLLERIQCRLWRCMRDTWLKPSVHAGTSHTEWSQISTFYTHWLNFATCKAFAWADQYNPASAPNRKVGGAAWTVIAIP